jgi:hypothetical protein
MKIFDTCSLFGKFAQGFDRFVRHTQKKEPSAGPGTTPVTMAGFPGYLGPADGFLHLFFYVEGVFM